MHINTSMEIRGEDVASVERARQGAVALTQALRDMASSGNPLLAELGYGLLEDGVRLEQRVARIAGLVVDQAPFKDASGGVDMGDNLGNQEA